MISSFFNLFLFALSLGSFISIIIFVVDVFRWHDNETKTVIVPSNSPELKTESNESEVKEDERDKRDVIESSESNSSTFSFTWSEP